MERIFIVTGANGFLGNTVVKKLLKKGERVRGLVMPEEDLLGLKGLKIEIVKGNVCDPLSLDPLFLGLEKCEIILIHTAGIVSIATKFDQKVYDVNVTGTENIIKKSIEYNVKRLIYISSVHAIQEKPKGEVMKEVAVFDPTLVIGLYAKTKAEATQMVLNSAKEGLDCVIIHPAGMAGPNDYGKSHFTQLVLDFIDGRLTASIKGGYDFVDVRDVSDGIINAVDLGKKGETYILANRYYEISDLFSLLAKVSGKRKIKTILPLWFAKFTAPLSELWYRLKKQPPLYTKYSLYTLSSNANFSHEKADRVLNYKTRDMNETLRDTIEFLKTTNRLKK
jgi:dihydroflavonol-4-reductase